MWLPDDDMKSVLIYCDVPTRCKLRRVSSFWKHLSCLPEINQVLLVDASIRSALSRRIPARYNKCRQQRTRSGWRKRTWQYVCCVGTFDEDYLDRPENPVRVPDKTLHGRCLFGPHVRVVIYNGVLDRPYEDYAEIPTLIRSVGVYCPNVEHVVLRHIACGTYYESYPSLAEFAASISTVTIMESSWFMVCVDLPRLSKLPIGPYDTRLVSRRIKHWSLVAHEWTLPTAYTDDDLAWVANYAPRLPEHYHQWAKAGIIMWRADFNYWRYPAKDLTNIAAGTGMDYNLLLAIAKCIIQEKVHPDSDPPSVSLQPGPHADCVDDGSGAYL